MLKSGILTCMAKSPKGVLFIGGDGPTAEVVAPYVDVADMIIAADSGYDLARSIGVTPDLLVGDMDSLSGRDDADRRLRGRIHLFDREKDETDTEIGLRTLRERGIGEVTIVGGGGGRLDHLIGILTLFERRFPPKRWFTAGEEIVYIDGEERFSRMNGVVCSFFPVGDTVTTMRSTGLRWPLDGLSWRHGDFGISNYGINETVTVGMQSGCLIMVRNLQEAADD